MLLSILVVQCVDKVITIYVGQVPKAGVDACCLGMGFDWYSGPTAPEPRSQNTSRTRDTYFII
jgi:hypothetical protein